MFGRLPLQNFETVLEIQALSGLSFFWITFVLNYKTDIGELFSSFSHAFLGGLKFYNIS